MTIPTMRERLIEAAMRADANPLGEVDRESHINYAAAKEVVDVILAELREPDEAMHEAGHAIVDNETMTPDKPLPTLRNAFTAMIDAIREGAPTEPTRDRT